MAKFNFNGPNHLIELLSPNTDFSVVELYSEAMDYIDGDTGISLIPPADATGNFPLGGGVNTDSIVRILEPWKLKPYDGTYTLVINGTLITDGGVFLDYNTQYVDFTVGSRIEGQTSGAFGTIFSDSSSGDTVDGELIIVNVDGTEDFTVGETLLDATGGFALAGTSSSTETPINIPPDSGNVTIRIIAASSGTVAFSEEVLNQSYNGRIWIDIDRGSPGTSFPKGTPTDPVDNFQDAKIIAEQRKLFSYHLEGILTLGDGDTITDTDWYGNNPIQSTIILNGTNSTINCSFRQLEIKGTQNGVSEFFESRIDGLTDVEGLIADCYLTGNITKKQHSYLRIFDSFNNDPGLGFTLDLNGDTAGDSSFVLMNGWWGHAIYKNLVSNQRVQMHGTGLFTVDSTCINGTMHLMGVGKILDFGDSGVTRQYNGFLQTAGTENLEDLTATAVWNDVFSGTFGDSTFGAMMNLIWQEAGGNRAIESNREFFYKHSGDTAMVFVLLDENGDSTETNVYQRIRIF